MLEDAVLDVCQVMQDEGTDKFTAHSYCSVYQELVEPIRFTELPILELGVCEGYSLRAWRKIFPDAPIYGIDCDPQSVERLKDEPTIYVELMDFRNKEALKAFAQKYGPFQMIVDDGNHVTADMIACRHMLDQFVAPGGVYVIEDVQDEASMELFRDIPGAIVHDLREVRGRKDDIMVVFQH